MGWGVVASPQSFSLLCGSLHELSCRLQISHEKRWVENREVCVKQSWIMARAWSLESGEVHDSQVGVGAGRARTNRHLCAFAGFCGLGSREARGMSTEAQLQPR